MNKNFSWIGNRGMAVVGFVLVLGCQACEEKKMIEQAPGKVLEAAAPNPAAEKSASASGDSAADASKAGAPAGSSK